MEPLPQRKARVRRGAQPGQNQKRALTEAQRERRRERNRRRRERRRAIPAMAANTVANTSNWMIPSGSASDTAVRRVGKLRTPAGNRLTHQGLSFIKCAFAPPDFAANDVAGVPDEFRGQTLVKKHRLVTSFNFNANTDYYILLAPVPGISFFQTSVAAGTGFISTSSFGAFQYSDFGTMFGSPNTMADIVTKFRYISNHIEILPTVNQMTWTGNIQVFKLPVSLTLDTIGVTGGDAATFSITGFQAINETNANQYTGSFNMGAYSACYNSGAQFDFQPILEGATTYPATFVTGRDFGQIYNINGIPGFDNQFETLCIRVSGIGSNTNNSCIIKTWACVEYQVQPGTLLYEFGSVSPSDELAIKLYREVILGLPVAVPFYDNEGFWQRVLRVIRQVSGSLSIIPGPLGMISGGVNSIASGVESLVL